MNAGIDLALARGRRRAMPQKLHQSQARIPGSRETSRYTTRHLPSSSWSSRMRSTALSGTMVSASTKQSTRPELAAVPTLRAAAAVRPVLGTRRTPASSAKLPTMAAVASSLPLSTTTTSKGVSGSQRSFRETPEARARLARMASRASPISASSFRAGITKERRLSVIALQDPPGDHQGAARQHRPLPPRADPQAGRHQFPPKSRGGIEAPGTHGELRLLRDVADEPRNVESHGGPEELPDAKPPVTQATRMKGLHHDDGSPRDASHFRQDSGRVVQVGEHEEEKRGREGSFLERKNSAGDQDRGASHDMHVAHVGGDHLESQLPLQPGREVAGPRAQVEQGSLGRQPCAHLLDQPAGAPFHDDVKYRLQHHSPRAIPSVCRVRTLIRGAPGLPGGSSARNPAPGLWGESPELGLHDR